MAEIEFHGGPLDGVKFDFDDTPDEVEFMTNCDCFIRHWRTRAADGKEVTMSGLSPCPEHRTPH